MRVTAESNGRCAGVFAAAGMAGSLLGAELGKAVDEQRLLALFGLMMIAVGLSMLRPATGSANDSVRLTQESARYLLPRLIGMGFGVGTLAGFFGIGGGFLIVPGLMLATGMALPSAIGTSLVAVAAFGLTTAGSYAISGFVDWGLVLLVIVGGVVGSIGGARLTSVLSTRKHMLSRLFSAGVLTVGITIVARGVVELIGTSG
jgi:uncharacterized membrane protein YfcA